MASSSARIFGCSINVERDEQSGRGDDKPIWIAMEAGVQPEGEATSFSPLDQSEIAVCKPYFSFLESKSDSGSVSMDSRPDPHNCFIDFFDRESHIETVMDTQLNPMQRESASVDFDIWRFLETNEEEEEIDLGLGIGSGSGSGSGRAGIEVIEIDSDSDDEIMEIDSGLSHVVDEEVEWEDLQNAVDWVQVQVEEPVLSVVAEEQEQAFFDVQHAVYLFDESDQDLVANSTTMDSYVTAFLDSFLDGLNENHGGDYYNAIFDDDAVLTGSPPASKKVLEDLPVVEITRQESSNGAIVCAVCKDEVAVEEKVTRLPCGHYYHGDCILPWLGIRNTCPVCRYELPTDDLEYEANRRRRWT